MNSKLEQSRSTQSSGADIVKYALSVLLVVAGLFAFYWYANQWQTGIRVLALVAGLVAAAAVFATSSKGLQTREFLSESRFELRKVVWPTRQETTRTTWVVLLVVVIVSLLLAGMDLVIQTAVKWLLSR